jgi:hypothetical protein
LGRRSRPVRVRKHDGGGVAGYPRCDGSRKSGPVPFAGALLRRGRDFFRKIQRLNLLSVAPYFFKVAAVVSVVISVNAGGGVYIEDKCRAVCETNIQRPYAVVLVSAIGN